MKENYVKVGIDGREAANEMPYADKITAGIISGLETDIKKAETINVTAYFKVPGIDAVRLGEADGIGWTVFLTKSQQAAYAIAHGYGSDMSNEVNGVKAVKCGKIDEGDGKRLIPSMYHGKNYFYAAAAIENDEDTDEKRHQIIIC